MSMSLWNWCIRLVLFFSSMSISASASSTPSITSSKSSSASATSTSATSTMIDAAATIDNDAAMPSLPTASASYQRVVFSDVDGTLVHYPADLHDDGDGSGDDDGLIYLPPSKTGARGVLSTRTLELCRRLRYGNDAPSENSNENDDENDAAVSSSEQQRIQKGGVPFVLISGMRTTTLFQRLPYLPRADAYVSESGGRIFYPRSIAREMGEQETEEDGVVKDLVINPVSYAGISTEDSAPFELVEDMKWRQKISRPDAAGSDGYDNNNVPIERWSGKLWEFSQTLAERGYVLDKSGYATAFRINRKQQNPMLASTFDDFLKKCSQHEGIPVELGCSTNLGCVDIYPKMSGKKNCAAYLVERFLHNDKEEDGDDAQEDAQQPISLATHAYCLCDDDNDVEMALACRAAYLPSVTSESMRALAADAERSGGKLIVMEDATNGIVECRATENALEAIIGKLQ